MNFMFQIYECLIRFVIAPSLKVISLFSPFWRNQLKERHQTDQVLAEQKSLRQSARESYFFFCSSAGEYEQSKPLIDKLRLDNNNFIAISFFSVSGFNYAKAMNESSYFFLSPEDTKDAWDRIFSAIQPTKTFFIKYELWPSVLRSSGNCGALYLIDAIYNKPGLIAKAYLRWALRKFDHIFCVSSTDQADIIANLGIDENKVSVVGDTKYDRVLDRKIDKKSTVEEFRKSLASIIENRRVVLAGSAWPVDLDVLLPAFSRWKEAKGTDHPLLVIAPHDISVEMVEKIRAQAKDNDLTHLTLGGFDHSQEISSDILIIDQIGMLAELYGISSAAFIGGAMTFRVHNVLEAASYDLPVAFGPYYNNSREAQLLVANSAATVTHNDDEVFEWLSKPKDEAASSLKIVQEMAGATGKILNACT